MHIVLVNQFYPPDLAPTGQVLHDLAAYLVKRGHAVTVLCSRTAYAGDAAYPPRETLDGVRVLRTRALGFGGKGHIRKLASYASWIAGAALRLLTLRPAPDMTLCLTTPPYIGTLGRLVAALRGHAHAHWIMDVYPDVLAAHGPFAEARRRRAPFRRLLYRLMRRLTAFELGGSVLTLTLGPDMADRLAPYAAGARKPPVWVPLWGNSALETDRTDRLARARRLRAERGWGPDDLVLLYSGNMGLGHRFEEFLEAARRLATEAGESRRPAPRFVFSGSGKRRPLVEAFRDRHPEAGIDVLPYAPRESLAAHLETADVLLASLEPAWTGCMVPSKIQGIFAAGKPALFVGPETCSMAAWIREAEAGWVVPPGDVDALLAAVTGAAMPQRRKTMGENAARFAREHFDRETNCERIAGMLEDALAALP